MGFFTKFKPMSALTNDELMDEYIKHTGQEFGSSREALEKRFAKSSEFDAEFKLRGLNRAEEFNKRMDILAGKK